MKPEEKVQYEAWVQEFGVETASAFSISHFGTVPTIAEREAAQTAADSAQLSQMRRANPFAAAKAADRGVKYAPPDPSKGDRDVNSELRHARGRATGEDGTPGVAATAAAEVFRRAQDGKAQK